ncbi:MAG: sulfite exporter TauE/SafE family protein [Thermodesulfobacteriota bacterium]|nr:sulfite exporter TauE/SafE family protein [Thermodesulfobacteriota bacterium]
MFESEYLFLSLIAFFAFLVKALTGFGPAIVFIALGSLLMPVQVIIPISAFLDVLAGALMLRMDWSKDGFRFWLPLTILMIIGSVVGSIFLKFISPAPLKVLIAFTILLLGVWFVLRRAKVDEYKLTHSLPPLPSLSDGGFTFLGGFCAGLLGIGGPPLVWQFGRKFPKRIFRQVLIPIFLSSSIARVIVYTSIGILDQKVIFNALVSIPGLIFGLYWGNRIFLRVHEGSFSRIIGGFLILVAIQLLRSY